ncbi:MAG: carboxypeptidase-like regulatory domain-containing protein, partial [Candidatus Auribacterota bacterium]|nr:carboxypeptidase-like regulatory domain-containing protein [Candidatus Auribacterota bacterium]
ENNKYISLTALVENLNDYTDLVITEPDQKIVKDINIEFFKNFEDKINSLKSPYEEIKNEKGFKIYGKFNPPLGDYLLARITIYRLDNEKEQEVAILKDYEELIPSEYAYLITEPGLYKIELMSAKYKSFSREFEVTSVEGSKRIDINADIFYMIEGNIVDEDGREISVTIDTDFLIEGKDSCGNILFKEYSPLATYYNNIEFQDCSIDKKKVIIKVECDGYIPIEEEIDFAEDQYQKKDFILKKEEGLASLRGTVENSDINKPIKGIPVTLRSEDNDYIKIKFADEYGKYSFENLKPGEYKFLIGDPVVILSPLKNAMTNVVVKKDENKIINFSLRIGGAIKGCLTDEEGNNISSATIYLKPTELYYDRKIEKELNTTTGDDGMFVFISSPAGEYEMVVEYLGNIYKYGKINIMPNQTIKKTFSINCN